MNFARCNAIWHGLARAVSLVVLVSGSLSPVKGQEPRPLPTASRLARASLPYDEPPTSSGNSPTKTQRAPAADPLDESLLDLDIDQLGNVDVVVPAFDIEVTSVTKTESTVGKSPAAIFVITSEMIRRSGATSVPEVLRMVPGVEVAHIDANKWAVSIRGFQDRYVKNLLVMIDGRSVYTPLFSGTYWDVQDVLLEDIDRIEVVRGPGGTIWGANAVNGVINIITKKANESQGLLITTLGGSEDKAITGVRYGGQIGSDLAYRVYGKHFERDHAFVTQGARDDWRQARFGARADWRPGGSDDDLVTLQGNYYQGRSGILAITPSPPPPPLNPESPQDARVLGGDFLSRWSHRIDDDSNLWFQFYYDQTDRRELTLDQALDIFDMEFGHVFPAGRGHRLTWGMHYRHVSDDLGFPSPFNLMFVPAQRHTNLVSAFVQDEITLIEDRLFFTVGSKFEHNDFTGFEYQPTGRLLWAIDDRQALWGSISRAIRTPSRFDDDVRLTIASLSPIAPATTLAVFGNRDVESENLLAYEIGYRTQPTDEFSWDASLFYNTYTDLTDFLAGTPIFQPVPPTLIIPSSVTNGVDGETYGVELSTTYAMTPYWTLYGAYSFLQMQLHAAPGLREIKEGDSPHNQVYLRSSWDLPHDFEFDVMTRYVDNLPNRNVGSYISLDLRLGYQIENWEFAVVGQGLLDQHRREFRVRDIVGTEADRGVFAQVTWRH